MNTALVYALMAAGALLFQPDAEYPFIPVQLVDQLLVARTLFQTLTVPLDTSQPPTLPWLEANNLYVVRTDLEARDPMSSAELVGPLRSGLGSQGRTEYHLVGEGAILRVKRVGASESRVSRLTYEGQVARWHDVSNVREINEPRVMSPDRRYLATSKRIVSLCSIRLPFATWAISG